MWRNFVNDAPMAREGQLDRFFFAKTPFHIQIVSEKAKNRTKNRQKLSNKDDFFQPPQPAGSVWTDFDRVKIRSNRF